MAIYTKYSQLITPSINLIGIDTHFIAVKVENTLNIPLSRRRYLRYKKNTRFFWK